MGFAADLRDVMGYSPDYTDKIDMIINQFNNLQKSIESNKKEIEKINNLLVKNNIVDENEIITLKKENTKLAKNIQHIREHLIKVEKENDILKFNEKIYNNLENLSIKDVLNELKSKYSDKDLLFEITKFLYTLHPYS